MGRRALRTGDLITPKSGSDIALWGHPEGNFDSSDIVVRAFMLGLLMGTHEYEWTSGKRCIKALVLDNVTKKMGWCDLKYLKRVE
jgi:hypothetical protein